MPKKQANPSLHLHPVESAVLLQCIKLSINQSPPEAMDVLYPLYKRVQDYHNKIGGPAFLEALQQGGGAPAPVAAPEPPAPKVVPPPKKRAPRVRKPK